MAKMKAAVPPDDEILDSPVSELSAEQFLRAISHPTLDRRGLELLPDKKKYELWVEENDIFRVSLRELLEKIRTEKKKVELEPPPHLSQDIGRLPRGAYAQLVKSVANDVHQLFEGK